jgi:hypothetical protein
MFDPGSNKRMEIERESESTMGEREREEGERSLGS